MTGVETFILQLCAAQKRAGSIPHIALEVEGRAEVVASAAEMGVPVHDFLKRRAVEDRLPRKLGTAMLRARRLDVLCRQLGEMDVLHVHAVGVVGFDAFLAAIVGRRGATIVTHHTTLRSFKPQRTRLSDVTFWLEKRAASRIVMPYAEAAEDVVAHGASSDLVAVVPFCVDEQLFEGSVSPPREGDLNLVMVSRLFEKKGHRELLLAVAQLHPRYPGLRLTLVGEGPERASIESEVSRLNLQTAVSLTGQMHHGAMPEQLRKGHVIVLPSHMHGETFPLSLLEGMCMGMPAIGTRWFGIPDIIVDGETGFVVEPGDVDALAAAIERYLVDTSLYASASLKAAQRVREHFTATAVARSYEGIYQAALARVKRFASRPSVG